TSMVHLESTAASAPTAARMGANTAPTTPTVSGNSATRRPSCLITMLRALPSSRIFFTWSSSCAPSTLNDSQAVFIVIGGPSLNRIMEDQTDDKTIPLLFPWNNPAFAVFDPEVPAPRQRHQLEGA